MSSSIVGIIIDGVGILIGLFSIYLIMVRGKLIGGNVKEALNLVVWGIIFNIIALLVTLLASRLKIITLPAEVIDLHHALMTVGMVFFIVSAKKFSDLFKS